MFKFTQEEIHLSNILLTMQDDIIDNWLQV